MEVVNSAQLPAPQSTDFLSRAGEVVIGPYDKLSIDVLGISELSDKELQVDGAGRISFPFAGAVRAAGKSPQELSLILEAALRQNHVRAPQVTVNLTETVSQVVSVEGEVNKPGLYPVVNRMSLLKAMARAEGLTDDAAVNEVVVFRTAGGRKYAALYNLDAIRRGIYDDPDIFANDVIVVGESRARRMFRDLLQIIPVISTPLVVALTN
ncbi:polysaccharide biosynthesis/export family protein [Allosphingosinicella vermicomposti]|uniref:polysaccharide biosynthesis/export family protein n=1 Tax=Allosphingosinicella vermicomposti TaxID=614671 RepID=UPI001FE146DE|nr:polysaccharide biosynthesis/export family protein [Allosphingosinicella vermicomposti]